LRERYPQLQVVGVEPGLKPAAAQTQTKVVGVLATGGTLASHKFLALQQQISSASGVRFLLQACTGLADQIEKGELNSRETASMVERYVAPLLVQNADTLVLGCTHYPFVQHLIEQVVAAAGKPVGLVDTGAAVARQLQRLLQQHQLHAASSSAKTGLLTAYTTGSRTALTTAFSKLLELEPTVEQVSVAVARTGK